MTGDLTLRDLACLVVAFALGAPLVGLLCRAHDEMWARRARRMAEEAGALGRADGKVIRLAERRMRRGEDDPHGEHKFIGS